MLARKTRSLAFHPVLEQLEARDVPSTLTQATFTSVKPTVTYTTVGQVRESWGDLVVQGNPADVNTFVGWLNSAAKDYAPFQTMLNKIVADKAPAHSIKLKVGQNQTGPSGGSVWDTPGVMVDSFSTKAVDLADMAWDPLKAAGGKDSVTIAEDIMHVVAERYYYATDTAHYASVQKKFLKEHAKAQDFENKYRQAVGLPKITTMARVLGYGSNQEVMTFDNGNTETVDYDPNTGVINSIRHFNQATGETTTQARPITPLASWSPTGAELLALWDAVALTRNTLQAPWLAEDFGQGDDAVDLEDDPPSGSTGEYVDAWGELLSARSLLTEALDLFKEAQTATGEEQTQLVHQGNALEQQAEPMVTAALNDWQNLYYANLGVG